MEFSRQGSPPAPPPTHTARSASEHRAGPPACTAASPSFLLHRRSSCVSIRLLTLPTPPSPPVSPFPLPLQPGVHMLFWTPGSFLLCLKLAFRSRGLRAGWGLGTVFTLRGVAPSLQLKWDQRGPTAAGGLWGHSGPPRSRAAPLGCRGSDWPLPPPFPPRPELCPVPAPGCNPSATLSQTCPVVTVVLGEPGRPWRTRCAWLPCTI